MELPRFDAKLSGRWLKGIANPRPLVHWTAVRQNLSMRVGVAHHLGWAVLVTAQDGHVVDRRRVELVDADLPVAPIHHRGGNHAMHASEPALDNEQLAALATKVRRSALALTTAALDELVRDLAGPIESISLRQWPADFPTDISLLRQAPFESQADSVMYRQVFAELGTKRGWAIHYFDGAKIEAQASALLGDGSQNVLHGPRKVLGPPWNKDHRMALAATILATQPDR